MEKSINNTLHSIVDYATNKFFSNYSSAKKATEKWTKNRFSSKSNSNVMLYSGLALAAAGAVYLLVKNRETVTNAISEFIEERSGMNTTMRQHA